MTDTTPISSAPQPQMFFGDATRHGRPFAKDPSVIRFGERCLMYYSMAPSTNRSLPRGWAIGIAGSHDLVHWKKVGEILPEQDCEKNGIVNGRIILLDGQLHLFYNTYGNREKDALCHATSKDGVQFQRLFHEPLIPNGQPGDWNASETGHPGVFEDSDGRTYLFVQGNNDKGRTWFLSCYEIGWRDGRPFVIWDSPKFPMKRLAS